jgi:hypothetical protein
LGCKKPRGNPLEVVKNPQYPLPQKKNQNRQPTRLIIVATTVTKTKNIRVIPVTIPRKTTTRRRRNHERNESKKEEDYVRQQYLLLLHKSHHPLLHNK